jgi:plasmid rolling circle replication initiator protein Rep
MGNILTKNTGKKAMPEMEKPLLDDPKALTGKGSNKGSNAVTHEERIASLSKLKKRSRQMSSHMMKMSDNPLDTKTACDVAACSTWLVFNHYYTVDQVRLSKARTCKKHLLCPVCAKIRSVKQAIKYMERLDEILKEFPHLVPAMLTLTVKNGDDLKERFDHLTKSWKTYQNRRRQWVKTNRGFNELCRTTGAVFSYEFTKSDKGWHPHFHAVVLLDSKMDVRKLSDEWKGITKDSYIVDIRKLKPNKTQDIADAFLEVFKYALKFSELDLGDNLEAFYKLRGKRLQGAYGSFWGVKVPEKMTDDILDDLPYIELFYHYISGKGYNLEKTLKHAERLNLSASEEDCLY